MRILGNRVLLKPLEPAERVGSIFIPERFRHHDPRLVAQYRVLAVGPGRLLKNGTLVPVEVKPGDVVLTNLYSDHQTLPDGTKLVDAGQIEAHWRE
jgi:chaperonin GroES